MKFSIIIPAYNAADHIHKALDSIVSQTCTDFELIVVCDSCRDDTAKIAESYGARVLNVEYGNEGPTRNAGIDAASGDWLLFMDDDDWWVHDHVLETIDRHMSDGVDVILFGFIWGARGYSPPGDWYACWNKCYRREFVGGIRFTDEKDRSDVGFRNYIFGKHPRLNSINEALYFYDYMREGSVSWKRGY